jgi:hypothetical protein
MPSHSPESPDRRDAAERPSAAGRDAEVNRGGADAVQKTTFVGARASAEPEADRERPAAIPSGRGVGAVGWVAIALLLLVLAFYLSGVF